jgi:type II secretory pathway component GspD/PulD (secretin)
MKEARVARAQKRKWIDLVAGLLVGVATQPLALLAGPDAGFAPQATPDSGSMTPLSGGPSRARMALKAAIEAERFGDLDKAATLYREAQARAADLPPDERRELDRRFAANVLAVQARRDAREQIGLAESALQHGRPAEAAVFVKKITVNELYLSAADKQRFQSVCQRLHVQPGTTPPAGNAIALAHSKIQQGRAELAKSDLDAAEALAREADQLHVTFTPQEDSPRRLIEDLEKARKDAKTLLLASRAALKRGALDRAEHYARLAEQQASPFTFMLGDSPSKVLKEIQSTRPNASANGPATVKSTETPGLPTDAEARTQSANTDKARGLVREGRQALARGDAVQARKYAEQASACHGNLRWNEDNPARLLEDINRAAPNAAATPATPATPAGNAVKTKDEALALLKQGREELAKGELVKANNTAARLRAARHLHWGYFEDTPDKFQGDVDHARLKHNKEESVELLAEARRRYDKRDYDAAEKLAYEAQTKHGQYSVLDFGDRPNKLLADVQAARQRDRRIKLPDPPTTPSAVADLSHGPLAQPGNKAVDPNNPQRPTNPANAVVPASFNTPPSANLVEARQIMKDARKALNDGAPTQARLLADRVRDMHVLLLPGEDSPENLYRDLDRLSQSQPNKATPVVANTNVPRTPAPSRPSGDNGIAETRARQLVVEARLLQRQNRLVEARDKIVEAQRLGVSFRPDEENPSQIAQQINFQARQRIDGLVHHAGETIRYGTQAPQMRCQEAERDLAQARQLALAFGQDLQPIEITLLMVNQLRANGSAPVVSNTLPPSSIDNSTAPVGAASHPAAAGSARLAGPTSANATQLLDKARLELKSGETANARHLAEEAIKQGAGEAGLAVLRSIDVEENAQGRRRTNSAFDAVTSAYYRGDYRQANLMLANIDTKQLDERRQARLREMLNTPEMQPNARGAAIALTGGQQPRDRDMGSRLAPQAELRTPGAGDAGHAHAGDDPGQSLLQRTRAMREVKFQQLRSECLTVQGQALERFRTGQTDAAAEMLNEYLGRLANEQLDPGQLALLRRPIESRLQQFSLLKQQAELSNNRFDDRSRSVQKDLLQAKTAEQVKQANVAASMKQYNELFKIGKYAEAEMVAMRVHDLDPDNPMATAAMTIARLHRHDDAYENNKHDKEESFLQAMHGVDNIGSPDVIANDITLSKDQERLDTIRRRKSLDSLPMPRKSSEERNIERKLMMPVTLSFVNQPLRQIVQDIRGDHGINIFVDEPALAEKGIGLDSPLSIQLDNIALKSGLKLLLNNVHLTYVVADDVLKITTEDQARGKLQQKVYQVTDLVIPVENFGQVGVTSPSQLGLEMVNQASTPSVPMTQMTGMPGGQTVGQPAGGSMANNNGGFASDANGGNVQVVKQRLQQTHEDMLIKLVTSTIEPRSWAEQGGPGTIDYHPLTMALVINQTPDIQDQVQDLLNALRRLIDQEVAVEVKFISIAEDFFERIGVNFNMNIVNKNRQALQYQPELTSGQFAQPGYINVFQPSNFLSGLTPAGTLTNDLNIPITNNTYSQAVPPFGGYPGVPGFGGLTLGLAFLSDIQVFLFMEAVQGDVRSNVMQAPKLTLFNGQTATITVSDYQFFTIGVNVQNGGFGQLIYNPQTTLFPLGTFMTIQAVISGDRRFVRLSLTPRLSNIVNGEVNLFPVVTPIFPLFDGTATGQPVVFTQFVQQPRLTSVSVQTTVAVPDGGTVLMGGLKRLSEGRNEYGPPIISKIPYLSRLFRNVGYGRSAESLLIMVTPRIIIQAEEEEKQTGYTPPPAVGSP